MERLPSVRDCYDQWMVLQGKVDGYYHDKPRERKRLLQEKVFRQIKNAVIKEAENIRQSNLFFEDKGVEQSAEQGHTYAQYALGKLLLSDDPEAHDVEDGIRWLRRAAESGNQYAGQAVSHGPGRGVR